MSGLYSFSLGSLADNFTSNHQPFVYETINNGILKSIRASPQKDINSSNSANFAHSREIFSRVYNIYRVSNNTTNLKMKWFRNRDASTVTQRQKYRTIGTGSLNYNGIATSFSQHNNINTTRDALTRVRAGGAIVPKKVQAKQTNNLTPSFQSGSLIRTQYRAPVAILGGINGQYLTMRQKQPYNTFISPQTDTGYANIYNYRSTSRGQPILYH